MRKSLLSCLLAMVLLAACLDVGTSPGLGDADVVVGDVTDTVDVPGEPDAVELAPCTAEQIQTFQCAEDQGAIQACTDLGWIHATSCAEDTSCFTSVLEPDPVCIPPFGCPDTVTQWIVCEYADLQPVDRGKCQQQYMSHAADTEHEAVINCFVNHCDALVRPPTSMDPLVCLISECDGLLTDCYVDSNQVGALSCTEIFDCRTSCIESCRDTCTGDLAPRGEAAKESCTAACLGDCQLSCQYNGTETSQRAFMDIMLCTIANCAELTGAVQQVCFSKSCLNEYGECLATTAKGDATCQETVACVKECSDPPDAPDDCITPCAQVAHEEAVVPALNYFACTIAAREEGGACVGRTGGEFYTCVTKECQVQFDACE